MAEVIFKNIKKVYDGNVIAVDDLNLTVADREFVVLVGPSGCGKSTTLRMLAGLEDISEGEIYIDGEKANDKAPKDRDIAMVFQNYALYPHMTVEENISFGLRLLNRPKDEIKKRVAEVSAILGLEEYLQRRPKALSGGQRQRVAIGRAIVRNPKVFLFDEPLSNLDARLRVQMRAEIIKLHSKLKATSIYVTHDQIEAMTMGDRIAVMNNKIIQQIGTPIDIYRNPVNLFVAGFIGSPSMNFINAAVSEKDGCFYIDFGNFNMKLPAVFNERIRSYNGRWVTIGIRPENIFDRSSYGGIIDGNIASGDVEIVEHLGSEMHVGFIAANISFTARYDPAVKIKSGESNREFIFDLSYSHAFDVETERAIF